MKLYPSNTTIINSITRGASHGFSLYRIYPDSVLHTSKLTGSFSWRDIMKLVHNYREVFGISTGAGDTALFWSDKWNGTALQQ